MAHIEKQVLYQDPVTQLLINKIRSKPSRELAPSYDSIRGFIYKEAEEIIGDENKTRAFLKKLEEQKILVKKLYEKVAACQGCHSKNIGVHYQCPGCNMLTIERENLLEHLICGVIDSENNFRKNGKLFCPRCKIEVVHDSPQFKKSGFMFNCLACGAGFEEPVMIHFCRNCGRKFSIKELELDNIYSYVLSEQAEDELKQRSNSLIRLKETGKKLAGLYKIEVVEADNIEQASKELLGIL